MSNFFDRLEDDPKSEFFIPLAERSPQAQARWWAVGRKLSQRQPRAVFNRSEDREAKSNVLRPRFHTET